MFYANFQKNLNVSELKFLWKIIIHKLIISKEYPTSKLYFLKA